MVLRHESGRASESISRILGTSRNKEQLASLERIKLANQSLTALISDILSFAKAESSQLRFHLADIDLQKSIVEAVVLVERQAARAGHTVVVEQTRQPAPRVRTDPHRWQQILLNLLTNAVKYEVTTPGLRSDPPP